MFNYNNYYIHHDIAIQAYTHVFFLLVCFPFSLMVKFPVLQYNYDVHYYSAGTYNYTNQAGCCLTFCL